jgi:hypothetical protein
VSDAALENVLEHAPPTLLRVQVSRGLMQPTKMQLPTTLGRFSGTVFMNLAGNGLIGTIPKATEKMTSIQHLDMSNNMLTGDPPDLAKLTKLTALLLADNQLDRPPPGLSELKGLELVTLFRNPKIKTLPKDIADLVRAGKCMVVADKTAVPVDELLPFHHDSPPLQYCQTFDNNVRRTGATERDMWQTRTGTGSMAKIWFVSPLTNQFDRTGIVELADCVHPNRTGLDTLGPDKTRPGVLAYVPYSAALIPCA